MSESQHAESIVSLQKKNSQTICEKWDKMGISWQGGNTGNSHTKNEVDFHGGTKPGRTPSLIQANHSSFDISDGKITLEIVKVVGHNGKSSFDRSI